MFAQTPALVTQIFVVGVANRTRLLPTSDGGRTCGFLASSQVLPLHTAALARWRCGKNGRGYAHAWDTLTHRSRRRTTLLDLRSFPGRPIRVSQRIDIDGAEIIDCMTRHFQEMENMLRTPPPRSRRSVELEFKERCKEKLGLVESRPKNQLFKLFKVLGRLGRLL